MIHTRLKWDNIKLHFSYTWWAYIVVIALLVFGWNMAYNATEYEPPADKKLQITFVGNFMSVDDIDAYTQRAMEEFPEMEEIYISNIPLDVTGEGDYSGYTKLQVVMAVGEGDIYTLPADQVLSYAAMGAFEPLDDLVAEDGALHGMFTEEEIAKGTFVADPEYDPEPHLYALPMDRFYGLLEQGVNIQGEYLTLTAFSLNPEYAEKAFIWMCEETKVEKPDWYIESGDNTDKTEDQDQSLPEIG